MIGHHVSTVAQHSPDSLSGSIVTQQDVCCVPTSGKAACMCCGGAGIGIPTFVPTSVRQHACVEEAQTHA